MSAEAKLKPVWNFISVIFHIGSHVKAALIKIKDTTINFFDVFATIDMSEKVLLHLMLDLQSHLNIWI